MNQSGAVEVSPAVVARIAGDAAMECYGVVGMASRTFVEWILSLIGRPPVTKGVQVHLHPTEIVVELHVVIEYGTRIITVADNVAHAVCFRLERALGTSALRVHVFVEDVRVGNRYPVI